MITASCTIPELFNAALTATPQATFLQFRKGEDISAFTFEEIAREVYGRMDTVIQQGHFKGDRIALLSENSCEWVVAYLAIVHAGCVVVPLDTLMPLPEVLHILEHSGARMLMCSEKYAEQCEDLLAKENRPVIVTRLGILQASSRHERLDMPKVDLRPSDLAAILYTSGTTGHSKGVMLSHENLVSNVLACYKVCEIRSNDNFLLLLPLHHAFASTVTMLLPIAKGARATLATSYRSRDVIDDINFCKVSVLVGVPQIFENMMISMLRAVDTAGTVKRVLFHAMQQVSQFSRLFGLNLGRTFFRSLRFKAGLSSVRLLVSGGAALPMNVNRFFESLGFVMIQGYGLTESSPVLCVNPPTRNKLGSVGPPLDGVKIRINNPSSEGIGEVCASGPNIMQGYFENQEASAQALDDGWLNTGDAGFLDRDGYLHLTGRLKNVIVTSAGKNVYPEELEAKLASVPEIAEALVIGVPRKDGSGERLCALLKLDEEYIKDLSPNKSPEHIAADAVRNFNSSSPSYQNIREWRIMEGEFEKTSTRKIKRFLYHDYFK